MTRGVGGAAPGSQRRLAFGVAVALGLFAVCELLCFALLPFIGARFFFADPALYTLTRRRIARLTTGFDAQLGWTNRYPTALGERPRPKEFGRPFLMTFGDSFTHGDEVGDGETWQAHLAVTTEADVYNFGVGAYGPDQALLRYRMTTPHLKAPFVTLGFLLENINRVVNRYRRFYYPPTGIPLTKPRFVLRDGRLVLVPNPIDRAEDLERLLDADFVRGLGLEDYWYARAFPPPHFPWSATLLQKGFWVEALSTAGREGTDPRPEHDLWADPEARDLLFAILDAFAAEARAAGSEPVFLVFPTKAQIERQRQGWPVQGLDQMKAHCRERGHRCFDGIGALATDPGAPLGSYFGPGGHLSPAGNEAVARAILRFFVANGIGPGSRVAISRSPAG